MLKLPSELAITQIDSLHMQLQNELDAHDDICLDISDVMRADTASVQLLCSLQKHLQLTGHEILWVGQSEALQEAVLNLGLKAFLPLANSA